MISVTLVGQVTRSELPLFLYIGRGVLALSIVMILGFHLLVVVLSSTVHRISTELPPTTSVVEEYLDVYEEYCLY